MLCSFLVNPSQKDTAGIEGVKREATKIISDAERLPDEGRLKDEGEHLF